MSIYVVFIILLQNYEKTVDAHKYRLLWKGLGLNYFKALRLDFLKVIYSTWVGMTPQTFILEKKLNY